MDGAKSGLPTYQKLSDKHAKLMNLLNSCRTCLLRKIHLWEKHERNPDVAGTGNTSSGPQSIVDALEQVRVILEDLRGELSDIKSQMEMGELE